MGRGNQTFKITLRDSRNWYQKTITQGGFSSAEHVKFMLQDGNYSCDCNRSLLLYDHDEEQILPCNVGENIIKLISIEGIDK